MKSVVGVVIVGAVGFFATAFDPNREMWAPLFVALVPLLAFLLWPVSDKAEASARAAHKTAA